MKHCLTLGLTFRSLIHFELIFACGERSGPHFVLLHVAILRLFSPEGVSCVTNRCRKPSFAFLKGRGWCPQRFISGLAWFQETFYLMDVETSPQSRALFPPAAERGLRPKMLLKTCAPDGRFGDSVGSDFHFSCLYSPNVLICLIFILFYYTYPWSHPKLLFETK